MQNLLEKSVIRGAGSDIQTVSYDYNYFGQCISKKNGLEEVRYLTDITRDHYNLLSQSVNGKTMTFTYDDNVVSFEREGTRNYYQLDELGSTVYLTGTDGAAYSPNAYDPFGNILDPSTGKRTGRRPGHSHSYTKEGNLIQPFAFTGYREEESGLYYAQLRSYDPQTGRFTGEDKVRGLVAMPDTVNHYIYCLNDPEIYIDENGLWPSLASIGEGLKNVGKGFVDSTVGLVKQAIDDPGKFAAAAVTGLAVGVVTGLAAGALVAAAPCVLAAVVVGTFAFGAAGAITAVAADYVGQKASKYYDPEVGINHDELKASALAGWTFGSIFGGGAAGITKAFGKAALTIGVKTGLAFGAGFMSGAVFDCYAQAKNPEIENPSIGYAIGAGLGTGAIAAATTYGIGKIQEKISSKVSCGGENGERQKNLDKWGTDSNGCNQGERHFN